MSDNNAQSASTSPFAAPAQSQSAPPSQVASTDPGDTSYYDNLPSQEPLVKPCIVPGNITSFEVKTSEGSGKPFINIAVQLFGEGMVLTNGDPVSAGKRLFTTVFLSGKDAEKFKRTGRAVKNLVLALHNIPLTRDGKAEAAAYAALPVAQKLANPTLNPDGSLTQNPSAFLPGDQWIGTKVLVSVRLGQDMDKVPRNEFDLLAQSTPQKGGK